MSGASKRKTSYLNVGARLFVLLSSFTIATAAHAIDSRLYGTLYSPQELTRRPDLEASHYEALKKRFANNDFDEILFPTSNAKSQRLTRADHQAMFDAIGRFMDAAGGHLPERYLAERPALKPFSIEYKDGVATVHTVELGHSPIGLFLMTKRAAFQRNSFLRGLTAEAQSELVRSVSKKFPQVRSLFDLSAKHLVANRQLFEEVLRTWTNLYRLGKSDDLLTSGADLAIGYWLEINALASDRQDLSELDSLSLLYLRTSFASEMKDILASFQMPGKLGNNFFHWAGYDTKNDVRLPKDQTTFLPMSRFEQLTKGIGPGECIRASCNRFFDGFYPDSLAFSVVQDGGELGYIGFYKVRETGGSLSTWYIDTIQTPGLVSLAGNHQILSAALGQFERYAMAEGALLSVAADDWNSINFKENAWVLQTTGVLERISVSFNASPVLNEVYKFVAAPEQAHHQEIMRRSGYVDQTQQMYDSLLRNNYQVRILAPPLDLTDGELDHALTIMGGRLSDQEVLQAGAPHLLKVEKLARLGALVPEIKFEIFEIFRQKKLFFLNSPNGEALIKRTLFPVLNTLRPNFDLRSFDPGTQTEWPSGYELELLMECLILSKNEDQFLQLIKEHRASSVEFGQIATQFIIPLFENKGFTDWNSLYGKILPAGADDLIDMSFAGEIVKRLSSLSEFETFVKISTGNTQGEGTVGDDERIVRLIVSRYPFFAKQTSDFPELAALTKNILDTLPSSGDVQVRKIILNHARTINQIATIRGLSHLPKAEFLNEYYVAEARAVQRFGLHSAAEFDTFMWLSQPWPNQLRTETLLKTVIPDLRALRGINWTLVLRTTLPLMPDNAADEKLAHAILAGNQEIDFPSFIEVANGAKASVYLGSPELRSRIFANELMARRQGGADLPSQLRLLEQFLPTLLESDAVQFLKSIFDQTRSVDDVVGVYRQIDKFFGLRLRSSLISAMALRLRAFPLHEVQSNPSLKSVYTDSRFELLTFLVTFSGTETVTLPVTTRDLVERFAHTRTEEWKIIVATWIESMPAHERSAALQLSKEREAKTYNRSIKMYLQWKERAVRTGRLRLINSCQALFN